METGKASKARSLMPWGVPLFPVWSESALVAGLESGRPALPRPAKELPAQDLLRLAQWFALTEQAPLALQAIENAVRVKDVPHEIVARCTLLKAGATCGYTSPPGEHPGHAWGAFLQCDGNALPGGAESPAYLLTRAILLITEGWFTKAAETLAHTDTTASTSLDRTLLANAVGLWHLAVGDGTSAEREFEAALSTAPAQPALRARLHINLASAHLAAGDPGRALLGFRAASRALRREQFAHRTKGVLALNAALALAHLDAPSAPRLSLRRLDQATRILDAARGVGAEQAWAQLLAALLLDADGNPESADAFASAEWLSERHRATAVAARVDVVAGQRLAAQSQPDEALERLVPALLLAMSRRFDVPGASSRVAWLNIGVQPLYEQVLNLAIAAGRPQLAAELIAYHRGASVRDVASAAPTVPRSSRTPSASDLDASVSRPAPPTIIGGLCELQPHLDRAARRYGLDQSEICGPEGIALHGPAGTPLPPAPIKRTVRLVNETNGVIVIAPPGQPSIRLEPVNNPEMPFWMPNPKSTGTDVLDVGGVRVNVTDVPPPKLGDKIPEPEEGVIYVVSQLSARALEGRRDIVYPVQVDRDRAYGSALARAVPGEASA